MIAQDTGSAIVGPARADLYFGAGADAGRISGRLRHNMRFVMLVPKSLDPVARGRKMPLPDPRPSAKIAKLFPQTDPLKDRRTLRLRRRPRHRRKADATATVPLPPAGRQSKPASSGRQPPPCSWPRTADEALRADSRTDRSATPQTRAQRRRARAVGQRRQTDQAAAEKASRRQGDRATSKAGRQSRRCRTIACQKLRRAEGCPHRRRRRRWRRSDAANVRSFRAAARKSMPGSICTA